MVFIPISIVDLIVDLFHYNDLEQFEVLRDNFSSFWANVLAAIAVTAILSVKRNNAKKIS